ncbi:hypothetical protein ACIPMU_06375 [Streptomyces cyaneofuscatus]|uniref:hypothetical protein n=1 Tax=Streptomyces cyaneofuscatus TaxID=66883 RepID=UPI0038007DF6
MSTGPPLPADAKQAAETGDVSWLRELMALPKATNPEFRSTTCGPAGPAEGSRCPRPVREGW